LVDEMRMRRVVDIYVMVLQRWDGEMSWSLGEGVGRMMRRRQDGLDQQSNADDERVEACGVRREV
jgi:hypothetical protein